MMLHPLCQERYQDASPLFSKRPPLALYFHCAARRLNLAVVSACKLQSFKNAESYVGEIARFFHYSPKRQRALDKVIRSLYNWSKNQKAERCLQDTMGLPN